MKRTCKCWLFACLMTLPGLALAADVRTFEENGSMIEETRHVERKPVAEIQMVDQKVIRMVERTINEPQSKQQSYYVPVTDFRLVPRVENRWNPFVESRTVYDRVPYTRYEVRTHTVTLPAGRKEWVQEEQVIQVPVRKLKFVNEERISRVVLGPAMLPSNPTMVASSPSSNSVAPINPQATRPILPMGPEPEKPYSMANRSPNQFGGISRFDSDPPRQPVPTWILTPSSIQR